MKAAIYRFWRPALLLIALAAIIFGYRLMFVDHAPTAFLSPEEDMSFAWYVPVFSLYVIWRERKELWSSLGAPSWWGVGLLLPALFIGFIGVRGQQLRFEIIGFAMTILSLGWIFYGGGAAKRLVFPSLFLFFCIPLATFLDVVTVHLRLFAVAVAEAMLSGFGAEVVRQGTMLGARDGSFVIDVASPCSGLRSLFAMMALTAGYAYFTQPTFLRRCSLFALSIPIAILGNVARILSIAFIANYFSLDFALGFYHDYSGYVVFAIAILLMLFFGGLLRHVGSRVPSQVLPTPSAAPKKMRPDQVVGCLFVTAMIVGVMFVQAREIEPTLESAPAWQLGEIAGFKSETIGATEAELKTLPADTRIERKSYTDAWGNAYVVSLVISGRSKSSIHRPELCLPSQGYVMRDPHELKLSGEDWRVIRLERGLKLQLNFAYAFANQDGFRTSSHIRRILRDVWDRSVRNRIDRWVMITVNAPLSDDRSLSAFLALLKGVIK